MMPVEWNLVADIGGTNARFSAVPVGALESQHIFQYSVEKHPQFAELLTDVLSDIAAATGWDRAPQSACLAVACPADNEEIEFTNSHWRFTKTELQQLLNCEQLAVINDFEAVAHGITELDDHDLVQIGGNKPLIDRPIGILGAGTGLGVAGLIPQGDSYQVIDTEGGHADYAPIDNQQAAVVDVLRQQYGRVSLERLLSGKGLLNIYRALCSLNAVPPSFETPADIVAAAESQQDAQAVQTVQMFCEGLGAAAGNLALTLGAKGGIYLAGGVVPRFQALFIASQFRHKFEDKGRFVNYLKPIPVFLVVRENLGLLGAAKKLIHR
jgi:glucokinase